MKKLLSLLFVFTFVACGGSDDDSQDENNDSTPQNTLTIGNNSYNLQDGVIRDFGDWWREDGCPENFNLDIELYEDTIVTDDTGRVVSGSGKYIYFDMASNGENLSNGDYSDIVNEINRVFNRNFSSYSALENSTELNQDTEESSCFYLNGFVSDRFVGNIVDGEEQEEQFDDYLLFSFLDGNLEFTRNSSNEITINLTGATMDESGLPVTVNYTGFLAEIDNTSSKNDFTRTKPRKNR